MKIMIVAHGWPPETEGGAERVAFFHARELSKRHAVTVLHRINRPHKPEYDMVQEPSSGFRRFSINNTFKERPDDHWLYRNSKIDELLKAFLDKERPDIVHMHHLTGLSTGLVPIAKGIGAKTVYTLHDFWTTCLRGQRLKADLTWCEQIDDETCAECVAGWFAPPFPGKQKLSPGIKRITSPIRTRAARLLGRARQGSALNAVWERQKEMRMILESVDALTATSNYIRGIYIDQGFRNGKILLVRDGMDPGIFQNLPERKADPKGRLRIGYLGSVIPSKGVHVLIEAYARLLENRATLEIYGEAIPYDGYPNYGDDLRRKAAGFPDIRFHGKYSNEAVPGFLNAMDVLVLPSIWPENAPLTISEAFMARVPVVAAGWGGMQERLANGGGMTYKPGKADALAEVLRHLIENPAQLGILRESIPKVPSASDMAPVWEQIYQELSEIKPQD
jgi:glycosyltransferase involved in cell wall biosynthesis